MRLLLALAAALRVGATAPYTMLVCEPHAENDCNEFCTSRTGRLHPSWHAPSCPSANHSCDGASIRCSDLKYVTVDDVAAMYGARQPATVAERTQRTALFVSVQTSLANGGGGNTQNQVEWLHVMAQGVSNVAHWLGPPEGWVGLKSMESKTGDQMHLIMDNEQLLADSVLPGAANNGIHVKSFTKQYETSPMPDGGDQIGSLVVQMVNSTLHTAVAAGNFPACDVLEQLKLGVADNYDYVFVMAADTGFYTSTHSNIHQSAIPGTGVGAISLDQCGGQRVAGVTVLQPLAQGQMGPFFHEWLHQYAAYLGGLSPQLGAGSGGHWGWTAFPDYRGVLGGFNYFLCPNGTKGFSMDPTKDPKTECNPSYTDGDPIFINVDELEQTLESPVGRPAGERWGTLGDPAGRPDYLWGDQPANGLELYLLGLSGPAGDMVAASSTPAKTSGGAMLARSPPLRSPLLLLVVVVAVALACWQ